MRNEGCWVRHHNTFFHFGIGITWIIFYPHTNAASGASRTCTVCTQAVLLLNTTHPLTHPPTLPHQSFLVKIKLFNSPYLAESQTSSAPGDHCQESLAKKRNNQTHTSRKKRKLAHLQGARDAAVQQHDLARVQPSCQEAAAPAYRPCQM